MAHGTVTAPWVLNDEGDVVVDGDMVLGPVEELFPVADPLASNRDASYPPFPSNTVLYSFDTDVLPEQLLATKDALNIISLYTPVRFQRAADGSTNFGGIRFRRGDPAENGCSADAGYRGPTTETKVTLNGCGIADTATGVVTRSWPIVHEIGHALGLRHEQQRTDRASFVDYDSSCLDSSANESIDFDIDGSDFGPYEYESIMHYGSYTWAKDNQPDFQPDAVYFDSGYLVLEIDSEFGSGSPVWQDIFEESLHLNPLQFRFDAVYHGPITSGQSTLSFSGEAAPGTGLVVSSYGTSTYAVRIEADYVVTGTPDSNNLDREDVSNWELRGDGEQKRPGCPALTRTGTTWADADHLLANSQQLHNKGDLSSLYDLYPASVGTPTSGQRLGTALAQGDFDGDGLIDLATADPTGSVVIFRGAHDGKETGETHFVPMEQIPIDDAAALAAGDFNNDGYDDLAVGSPDWDSARGGVLIILGSDAGLDYGADPVGARSEDSFNVPIGSAELPRVWKLNAAQTLEINVAGSTYYADPDNTAYHAGTYAPLEGTDWTHAALGDFTDSGGPVVYCRKEDQIAALFSPGARVGASLLAVDLNGDGAAQPASAAPGRLAPGCRVRRRPVPPGHQPRRLPGPAGRCSGGLPPERLQRLHGRRSHGNGPLGARRPRVRLPQRAAGRELPVRPPERRHLRLPQQRVPVSLRGRPVLERAQRRGRGRVWVCGGGCDPEHRSRPRVRGGTGHGCGGAADEHRRGQGLDGVAAGWGVASGDHAGLAGRDGGSAGRPRRSVRFCARLGRGPRPPCGFAGEYGQHRLS